MTHKHRAVPGKDRDRCWMECIAPHESHSERAHGNIVREDVCACGATRLSEINGGATVYGPWNDSEEDYMGGTRP